MTAATSTLFAICDFLAARYAEEDRNAREIGTLLVTKPDQLGIRLDAAEQQARAGVRKVEARQSLLDNTIRPYLGTAGPTGRIAEQQLRLLAWGYSYHRNYEESWRP
jgi:hypothetical protein